MRRVDLGGSAHRLVYPASLARMTIEGNAQGQAVHL